MDKNIIYFKDFLQFSFKKKKSFVVNDGLWKELYNYCKKQALIGISLFAIKRLPDKQKPPKGIMINWSVLAEYIKNINIVVNNQCVEIQKRFAEAGFDSCILKGQGIGALYGELSLYRQFGDLDIWVAPQKGKVGDWKAVMDYVNSITPNREFDGKHTHLNVFQKTPVEVHWWPSITSNFIINRRLKHFYREQFSIQCCHEIKLTGGQKITAPNAFFNSIYILLHIFDHLVYDGVSLRQIMDFYFVCIQDDVQNRKKEILYYYQRFGILSFSSSVMWVLMEVLGMDEKYLLTKPNEEGGYELLIDIIKKDNLKQFLGDDNNIYKSTLCRLYYRVKRKVRLFKHNPIGVMCYPYYKIRLLCWKQHVIKMYNL